MKRLRLVDEILPHQGVRISLEGALENQNYQAFVFSIELPEIFLVLFPIF